ncbi:Epidermin biosynthesis protein epiB [Fibrella aestuarina BUZ 2]|uniref:Epidermin biosynthesis protein epiB n=1 Tax=Fibrella aestuarina BUZ 2 TaxID=1166018 RepID=I0K554_9BACT|nr:lantibiotic dehydratase [Fibrella aestuarina]CCG99257.1 Epidermin biosynthesis protein epiB [Fibrella aestuarina BUZ 2]
MQLHPFYVLRRPLLPVETYFQVQHRLRQGHALIDVLKAYYQHPYAQQALFFASSDVYQQCQQWLAGTLSPSDKVQKTLYRYLIRMSTRATPFGLCSGISLGKWGTVSGVTFDEAAPVRTYLRLDAMAMQQLLHYVSQLPAIWPTVRYRSNTTTYAIGADLRYVEANQQGGLPGSYALSVTDNTEYLQQILERARHGATLPDLITLLMQDGIEAEDAQGFLDNLIDNQLIQSEFDPSLTAQDELGRLLERLRPFAEQQPAIDLLTDVHETLRRASPASNVPDCQRLDELLAPILAIENRLLVQCDTYFPASQNTIGEAVREQLSQTLQQILRLSPAEQTYLPTFRERFYERYEEQEVPLLLALDPDIGVGYGGSSLTAALLDGIDWPEMAAGDVPFTVAQQTMLRLFTEAMRLDEPRLDLLDADLATLTDGQPEPALPASGYWMGHLLASSAEALDAGDWQFHLVAGGGPSAANLLGRMAHLDDELKAQLQASLQQEEASEADAIWAEIVHLPEAKLANVLTRPALRSYEIPILSVSGVPDAYQIPLDDLLISAPRGQRIVLRSRRLNKRVIPRLSTAHNFSMGLAHYRFLCDLQKQEGTLRVGWDWGPLSSQPYLPQVRYRNVILSRAAWQLTKGVAPTSQADWLASWRSRYHVPRYVVMMNADNELPLDLENGLNVELLVDELTKHGTVKLKEWLLNEQTCWVGGPTQHWVGELILPASFTSKRSATNTYARATSDVQRIFAPGSEWVYLKIVTGEQASERLLLTELPILTEDLREAGSLSQWFYVRYNHPEPQLRVRFQSFPGQDGQLLGQVLAWVQRLTADYGTLYRVQLDTYQREVERYGAARIALCEAWFCTESEMLLPVLQLVSQEGETSRLFYACALVDRLFEAWQLPLDQRDGLITRLRDAFSREFRADTALLVQLDKSYRLYRPVVHDALSAFDAPAELASFAPQFRQLASELQTTLADQNERDDLLASLIHMLLNRIFPTENRRHEYLLYHLLKKEYTSLLKRNRPAPNRA